MNTTHKVWKLGADIDTDQLAPGTYMKLGIEGIAPHCLEGVRPEFASQVRPGDVIAAGPNFGIGSSREQAAAAGLEMISGAVQRTPDKFSYGSFGAGTTGHFDFQVFVHRQVAGQATTHLQLRIGQMRAICCRRFARAMLASAAVAAAIALAGAAIILLLRKPLTNGLAAGN